MKIYIFPKNKGILLIEYIIVNLLFFTFIIITTLYIKSSVNLKNKINGDISNYEINKILDRIVYKLQMEDKIIKYSNKLTTNSFELHFKDKKLFVASNKNIRPDFLFSYDLYDVNIMKNKIELNFKIKNSEYKRVLSLK